MKYMENIKCEFSPVFDNIPHKKTLADKHHKKMKEKKKDKRRKKKGYR